MIITSTANPQVKHLVQLQKKASARDREGVYLAEGPKMCLEAEPADVAAVYVSETFWKGAAGSWDRERPEPVLLSDAVFQTVSDTKTPQGILCVLKQKQYSREALLGSGTPLLLVLERLQDPGNLGTIMRSAEGAGVTGVLMTKDCVDIYAPKTIRSTMGAVLHVPFAYTEDLGRDLQWLREKGVRLYAAHLHGAKAYDRCSYSGPCAFLIGNESRGLTDEAAMACDERILIPMLGTVESLNAGIAASLLVYEAARQRRADTI